MYARCRRNRRSARVDSCGPWGGGAHIRLEEARKGLQQRGGRHHGVICVRHIERCRPLRGEGRARAVPIGSSECAVRSGTDQRTYLKEVVLALRLERRERKHNLFLEYQRRREGPLALHIVLIPAPPMNLVCIGLVHSSRPKKDKAYTGANRRASASRGAARCDAT